MRVGVTAVLAVLLGAFAAHFLLADRGYVLVNFRSYVIEMSVPGLVIVLALAYVFVRALGGGQCLRHGVVAPLDAHEIEQRAFDRKP